MITKKKCPKKLWVDKGTEFAGQCKKNCNAQGMQIYSRMSETKAAFAERTIRLMKNILYGYMADYGYKYVHNLPQFVTTLNFRKNCSISLKPKSFENSDFLSIRYSKPLGEYRKPKLKI